jgi:hypothetical protein
MDVYIFVVGIIVGILLVLYFIPRSWFKKIQESTLVGPLTLAEKPQIGKTEDSQLLLSASNTGSFQAFVYPLPLQRTGEMTFCSDTPGQENCSTGRFGICSCVGNDCSSCKHKGYVNILNISNVVRVELLAAPDAGRQGSASVQLVARCLRKKEGAVATEVVEETLVLPNIPFQKWTMITVAREGRRFDVYYNNSIVLSKRIQYILDSGSAVSPIIAGDPRLDGMIAHVNIVPKKFTASDVSNTYKNKADTNGEPYLAGDTQLLSMITNMTPYCKDGSCVNGPNIKPASPLMSWDTSYA